LRRPSDKIALKHAVFGAIAPGPLAPAALRLGTHAGDTSDRIVYDGQHGNLCYDRDGSGAAAPIQFTVLDNHASLTVADFVVVG
jgi:Ca2+-binding RTX toxin-like protein